MILLCLGQEMETVLQGRKCIGLLKMFPFFFCYKQMKLGITSHWHYLWKNTSQK